MSHQLFLDQPSDRQLAEQGLAVLQRQRETHQSEVLTMTGALWLPVWGGLETQPCRFSSTRTFIITWWYQAPRSLDSQGECLRQTDDMPWIVLTHSVVWSESAPGSRRGCGISIPCTSWVEKRGQVSSLSNAKNCVNEDFKEIKCCDRDSLSQIDKDRGPFSVCVSPYFISVVWFLTTCNKLTFVMNGHHSGIS